MSSRYFSRVPSPRCDKVQSDNRFQLLNQGGLHRKKVPKFQKCRPIRNAILRKHLFEKRYFGEVSLWSADSRYLALSEWRSFVERRGPDTQLVVIDILAKRECTIARTRGFVEPVRFEGNTFLYTRTSYDKQVRAHVESCIVDLVSLHNSR
jgi:hypothetical protein